MNGSPSVRAPPIALFLFSDFILIQLASLGCLLCWSHPFLNNTGLVSRAPPRCAKDASDYTRPPGGFDAHFLLDGHCQEFRRKASP